jgi:hypothetical protein
MIYGKGSAIGLFAAVMAAICMISAPMAQATPIGDPMFTYTFDFVGNVGSGSLNTTLVSAGEYNATSGSLTITGGSYAGSYSLVPGGPSLATDDSINYDNDIFPSSTAELDGLGLLFGNATYLIDIDEETGDVFLAATDIATGVTACCTNTGPESDFSVSEVPEPASFALFGAALIAFGAARRRKRG